MNELEKTSQRRSEARSQIDELKPALVALGARKTALQSNAGLARRDERWTEVPQFEAEAKSLQPEIDGLSAQISGLVDELDTLKAKETALYTEARHSLDRMNEHLLKHLALCVRGPDFVEAGIAKDRARWAEIMG